ncbi:MAG: septum formation protein Maf [Prolixibacteraceae bacterium]|nr:septum formation protein Maf [Prolixibacteraceae bacterium]MBN2773810.1 septum formation protein Maf [Prolixibacteraceae bacterium]
MDWMKKYNIILASKSPRRQQLLKDLDFEFIVKTIDIDEVYPDGLTMVEIPVFLAELKAKSFNSVLKNGDLLITADTIVWHMDQVLGKPENRDEAFEMLSLLSNSEHQVITGVCLKTLDRQKSFYSVSNVVFKKLTSEEIIYYIDHYKPYDKAGGYGIQEWIGYIGISHIEGSFFNVMGLPVQKLYCELKNF